LHSGTKKFLVLAGTFLLLWLSVQLLFPLFAPFLVGAILALAAEPMTGFLHKKAHIPRSISAGIGVGMTFCFLAMVLLCLCAFLLRELRLLTIVLPDLEQTAVSGFSLIRSWLLDLSAHTPQSIRPVLQENISTLFSDGSSLLRRASRYLLSLTGNLLTHVPDSALSLGTAVISAFLISSRLPRIRRWLLRRIPAQRRRDLLDTLRRVRKVFLHWLTAQSKLMGISFLILFFGFVILRIPYALLWALGICLVDAFPVLGTGTILLPWSFVCLLQQDMARAAGIGSLYLVVSLTRSTLEPKFLGRHLGLDPLVTLIAIYAGYRLWGFPGMLFTPILTVAALQLVPDRRRGDPP